MTSLDWLSLLVALALVGAAAMLAVAEASLIHLDRVRARSFDHSRRAAGATGRGARRTRGVGGAGSNDGVEVDDIAPRDEHRARKRTLARAIQEHDDAAAGAGRIESLVMRLDEILPPLLLLRLLCQVAAVALVTLVAEARWGGAGTWVAFGVAVVLLFVLTEAGPKMFALRRTQRAATRIAPVVAWLALFAPVRWLARGLLSVAWLMRPSLRRRAGAAVTEADLRAMADAAAQEEGIAADERALLRSVVEFSDTVTREVMVPRTDMVTVEADFRVVDAIEVAILNGFSRLPATGPGGIDDIVGVVYAKDLMRADRDGRGEQPVAELARPAHFVPEAKKVHDLLRSMQAERYHLAIVVDEYGTTAGVATLEDVIEELVGEIRDEYDLEEPLVEPALGGGMRVNARMDVDDLAEVLGVSLPAGEWDSVGGLVVTLLGRLPEPGEEVEVGDVVLRAERVIGRRVASLRVTTIDRDEQAGAPEAARTGSERP